MMIIIFNDLIAKYLLKCVNYLKHERFIEARKVYRGLTHFIFKCSIAIIQLIKCFIYFQ